MWVFTCRCSGHLYPPSLYSVTNETQWDKPLPELLTDWEARLDKGSNKLFFYSPYNNTTNNSQLAFAFVCHKSCFSHTLCAALPWSAQFVEALQLGTTRRLQGTRWWST